jgi:hypothetical protein
MSYIAVNYTALSVSKRDQQQQQELQLQQHPEATTLAA